MPQAALPGRLPFQPKSLEAIRRFNDDLLSVAGALDGFLNGESLVLVLEFGSARILLPGDAEVGAWTTILANPAALELAASATFMKVGHHGSHNATPLSFVREHLAEHTPAVISTKEGTGSYRRGIPLQDLLEEMQQRNMPVARSDMPPANGTAALRPTSKDVGSTAQFPVELERETRPQAPTQKRAKFRPSSFARTTNG